MKKSTSVQGEDRDLWLTHIAHDIGAFGETKAFKIIEGIYSPHERVNIRKLFYEVIKLLEAADPSRPHSVKEQKKRLLREAIELTRKKKGKRKKTKKG